MTELIDDNSPAVNHLIGLDFENCNNEFPIYSIFLCNPHLTRPQAHTLFLAVEDNGPSQGQKYLL